MKKLQITLEDAKATLRDAATGPDSQNWRYSPAVRELLNSHDELLVALGEMKQRAEAAEQRLQPIIPTRGSLEVNEAAWKLHDMLTEHGSLNGHQFNNLKGCFYEALKVCMGPNLSLQPALPDDYFGLLVRKARASADQAMRKHPQPNYVLNKVAEESGEVIKAVIHYTEGREEWVNVEGEIIDNLAMLIRLVIEGDQVIGFTPPEACHTAYEPHKLTGIPQSDHLKRALKLAGEAKELADRIRAEELTLQAPVVPDDVAAALDWIDDFIARCNGDDRGSCNSVNILRRAILAAMPATD
ncbi:hypothetical protein [Serratia fonticola]